jgi:hypothetical protein
MSLTELLIHRVAYVLEAGGWAVVPVLQEGETLGKCNVLDNYIFSTESS